VFQGVLLSNQCEKKIRMFAEFKMVALNILQYTPTHIYDKICKNLKFPPVFICTYSGMFVLVYMLERA
jgi:hypothetical protein